MTAPPVPIFLNQFKVKTLAPTERRVPCYTCHWRQNPQEGTEAYALNRVCYRLNVPAARWGSRIVTLGEPQSLATEEWELTPVGSVELDCQQSDQREPLTTLYRQQLRTQLEQRARSTQQIEVERGTDNSIRIWQKAPDLGEAGWEIHKGYCLDVRIDSAADLYLEIDCAYRFWTPWTLHQWLETYPETLGQIKWVRNTYRKNNQYRRWQFVRLSQERPEEVLLTGLNMTLAQYHRNEDATAAEIAQSQVVYVKDPTGKIQQGQPIAHLSQRLTPSITMELLAELTHDPELKPTVDQVFQTIRVSSNERFLKAQELGQWLSKKYYGGGVPVYPLQKEGEQLPSAVLLAKGNQRVRQVAAACQQGFVHVGETQLGLLNLATNERAYPPAIRSCLEEIGRHNQVTLELDSYRTAADLAKETSDLARQRFWRQWFEEGVHTVLVVMPYSGDKQRIRNEALRAGIATQFVVPQKINDYKATNVVLGLLCKAKWQPVRLQPSSDPEAAELIIGFDTGTNRQLYFGTPAFAVLADGQSLGWELPTVQQGEKLSGAAVWQTVLKLMDKFYTLCHRYPRKVLLMRDGLTRVDEFTYTIEQLEKERLGVDILSVRKSGAGRMAQQQANGEYVSAPKGTVVYNPNERSFLLITSQPIGRKGQPELGSARPLYVVHAYGTTPLPLLALQTYHLAQLHPASGFSHARLPWVLHLAHKSSQEFSRIEPLSLLEALDRDKLIAV